MKTHRRTVTALAGPGILAARHVYLTVPSDAVRVAALVEIAGAAAALARTVVKLRHLDPDLIAPHVSNRTDLRAVLGRGQWLPTMTRPVASGPELTGVLPGPGEFGGSRVGAGSGSGSGVCRRRMVRRRQVAAGQGFLFPAATLTTATTAAVVTSGEG